VSLFSSGPASAAAAGTKAANPAVERSDGKVSEFLHDLLPLAWQKRPKLFLNVFTEMTPEGRTRRVPSPEQPMYYYSSPGQLVQTGWMPAAGEKPPPTAELEDAMKKALTANGYVPIEDDHQRPEILVVFAFGSNGTDPASLDDGETVPTTAEEMVRLVLRDPSLYTDVIQRARFVGGDKFGFELKTALDGEMRNMQFNRSVGRAGGMGMPVNPDGGSPFQMFLNSGNDRLTRHLAELAFHTCYFVTATAYDFSGVERKQKIPLWQTRMAVEAQGVAMDEVLRPLIANGGSYLGRETREAVILDKRIDREGHVHIGDTTVVEESAAGAAKEKTGK